MVGVQGGNVCVARDIKDLSKAVTTKIKDTDIVDVVSLLLSVQLFKEDLEVNLTVQQFQCDELKIRIFFNKVEAKEMKAALSTMIHPDGIGQYFYDGGYERLVTDIQQFLFPHRVNLLEAQWAAVK